MIKKAIWIGFALSLFGFLSATVQADEWNKKTVLTFSQPVEIPGQVLPAGIYTFKLVDSLSDRHIVQVFNADESKLLATVMTIPDSRLTPTDQTVIRFNEVPVGSPEAIRAWFYPGNTVGQEFVYPKARAMQLAKSANAVVPAISADAADIAALKIAPIMAITPDEKETPVAAAIQTSPVVEHVADVATVPNNSTSVAGTTGVRQPAQSARNARHLPKTASALPFVLLLGFASIGVAIGLMVFGRHTTTSAL